MARAVTAFQAFGIYRDEPVTNKAVQIFKITGTAANTDTAFDFGNFSGTFWTDAGGSVPGAAALRALRDISSRAQQFFEIGGLGIKTRTQSSAQLQLLSGTVAAGSATPLVTVTGLATTDVILAVTQRVQGANNLPLLGWNTQITNGITAAYSANPGANAVLDVLFRRPAAATPSSGAYILVMDSTNILVPNLTFASGDVPTTFDIILWWILKDGEQPVRAQS